MSDNYEKFCEEYFKDKPIFTKEDLGTIRKNSCTTTKRKVKASFKKGKIDGVLKTTLAGALTATILIGSISLVNYANDKKAKDEAVVNYGSDLSQVMVLEGSYGNRYYDCNLAAMTILENRDEFDIEVYKAYDRAKNTPEFGDAEIRATMNDILLIIKDRTRNDEAPISYETFKEYVESLGFVDNDGNADYKKYSSEMRVKILKLYEAEQEKLGGR